MAKKRTLAKILVLLYIAAVGFLCFANLGSSMEMSPTWLGIPKDKVAHFCMFLPFIPLAYAAFHSSYRKVWGLLLFLLLLIVIGAVMGGGIELIQGMTAYRSGDIEDFRADCLGLFTGAVLTLVYYLAIGRHKTA